MNEKLEAPTRFDSLQRKLHEAARTMVTSLLGDKDPSKAERFAEVWAYDFARGDKPEIEHVIMQQFDEWQAGREN